MKSGEGSDYLEQAIRGRWDEARAWAWYDAQPWLVGCNFIPSGAVNQLEMWQEDTFDAAQIDRELGWLAALGMNTVRVFLHDLLWTQDAAGFLARIDTFLSIAELHGIGAMIVFFDSVWYPSPRLGPQRAPMPGVHNSFWVQSPGLAIVKDSAAFDRLEDYVAGVIGRFCDDRRVQVWDLWNEPDNANVGNYPGDAATPEEKGELVAPLVAKTFRWARTANPTQPLTSGVWIGDWSSDDKLTTLRRLQLLASDVVSFHCYSPLEEARGRIEPLKRFGRPLLCTEYLARGAGSRFESMLPYFKQEKIGAYNWGAVVGKTQTHLPWDSWQKPYATEPAPWHHDIFRADGTPYDAKETEFLKSLLVRD